MQKDLNAFQISNEERERLISIKIKHESRKDQPTYTSFY